MGRSVSHPSGAIVAFNLHGICEQCDKPIDGPDYFDFDDLIEDYQRWIKELFPSFDQCDLWLSREDHAIAENRFAYFGISEYCGLVAIWLVGKEPERWQDGGWEALRDRWLAQVGQRFLATFGTLRKLGHMSNGEGVFAKTGG